MLSGSGRLLTRPNFPAWLERALSGGRCLQAPFNFMVASEAARIRLPQNDFADVFLAATASALGFTLITADGQLLDCNWLKTLADD